MLTTENESEYLYINKNKVFDTIEMPLVATSGIIYNLAFLFVLYRVKRMRTMMNFYLANLAFSDMGLRITTCTLHFVMETVEFGTTRRSGFG